VTFCDISKCHNVTLFNFVTFLGFCHTVCIFSFFLVKPKMSKKVEMSQMSQIRCLCRALFRRCANIYVLKLRFAVVWLGRIQNLDTRYADVLGLKSGSDRLSLSIYSITILLGVFFKSLYHSLSFLRCLSDSQLSSSPSCSFTRFSTQWSPQKCFP